MTGGFDLGLERAGMEATWQVEVDEFCCKVLEKHWPGVKRYGDIRQIEPGQLEAIDLICGGPPCQPASVAGKRGGTTDDRWLWPETLRLVAALKPRWCLFENPTGILSLQGGVPFESVLSELESQGYEVQAFIIPAGAVDAPHYRDRVWMVAHADGERLEGLYNKGNRVGLQLPKNIRTQWQAEPRLDRVAIGIPHRVDRLRSLGNSVVPQVVEIIGRAILAAEGVK